LFCKLQIEASAELPHPKTLAVSLVGIGREFFKKKCLNKRLHGKSFLSIENKWLYNYYLKCDERKRTLMNDPTASNEVSIGIFIIAPRGGELNPCPPSAD